jgi:hypothetical protein
MLMAVAPRVTSSRRYDSRETAEVDRSRFDGSMSFPVGHGAIIYRIDVLMCKEGL